MSEEAAVEESSAEAAVEEADAEEVLSEEEKEALLAGMAEGDVVGDTGADSRTVVPFVLRPDAYINYGSYPLLQAVTLRTAKRLAQKWSSLTGSELSISARELYSATYGHATERLRAPMLTFRVSLLPLPLHSIVVIDNPLLAGLVDNFFGFAVDLPEADGEDDETSENTMQIREQFTEGECRVAELAITDWCDVQSEAWEKTYPVTAKLIGYEPDPAVGSGLEPKDPVVVAAFEVQLLGASGLLYWLIPEAQIVSIADDLEGATNARPVNPDPEWLRCWTALLGDTDVNVQAMVGEMRMTLRDVLALQPGDFVPLKAPDVAQLGVGTTTCAVGDFGNLEGMNAFRLRSWAGN